MSDNMKTQIEFMEWIKNWVAQSSGNSPKEMIIQPDILNIMAIFKILGFETLSTEIVNPENEPKLKNSRDGIKIAITCTTSGMKSIMELETRCKCPKNLVDSTIWNNIDSNTELVKYSLDNDEVNELIAVPREIEYIIQSVTNHFLHLIEDNDQNSNATQSKSYSMQLQTVTPKSNILNKQNTFCNLDSNNLTVKVISPARYRSLDTLTGNLSICEIPEPGKLRKNESNDNNMQLVTSSSPNVAKMRRPSTSSPSQNCESTMLGYTKLLEAQTLIHEVLGIMENKQNDAKLNFDISKIKGSTDCLLDKQVNIQETTPKILNIPKVNLPMKPKCRASIRSMDSLKPIATKSPIIRQISKSRCNSSSSSSAPATKSLENVSSGVNKKTPIIKPNPKYMHIKSTISKTKTIVTTKK